MYTMKKALYQGDIMKKKNKGFTLIEMLVVVLIIGILAGIALPQYNKAVEKARLSEGLLYVKTIEDTIQRYILSNGYPSESVCLSDLPFDIELSGVELYEDECGYITKNFTINGSLGSNAYIIEIDRTNNDGAVIYVLNVDSRKEDQKQCLTQFTDMGTYICHYLESQGWAYWDNEF